jgi:hypothetical protein
MRASRTYGSVRGAPSNGRPAIALTNQSAYSITPTIVFAMLDQEFFKQQTLCRVAAIGD